MHTAETAAIDYVTTQENKVHIRSIRLNIAKAIGHMIQRSVDITSDDTQDQVPYCNVCDL